MSNSGINIVDFGFIRYANCWEDADILLEGLSPEKNCRLISICSAGDNSFSLLVNEPSEVIAVDVNETQLWLAELKIAAIKNLSREEYLHFAGFRISYDRKETYQKLKNNLSEEAKAYWNYNLTVLDKGIIYNGKFEKYFNFFAKRLIPLMHNKKRRDELFRFKNKESQKAFYSDHWNNRRWRLFFKLFFSKYIMGKFGRDPKFLEQVQMNVSEYIYQKAGAHLSSVAAQDNYMLHFIITGNYGECLPHYAREENYDKIQSNIHRIVLKKGYLQDVAAENGKFDGYNLSDIFEYMDEITFRNITTGLISSANPGAKFAYWNLMVPRNISEMCNGVCIRNEKLSAELTKKDKGFFYNCFYIDELLRNE